MENQPVKEFKMNGFQCKFGVKVFRQLLCNTMYKEGLDLAVLQCKIATHRNKEKDKQDKD